MTQIFGLTDNEALARLKIYGKNEIKRTHKTNPLKIFLSQFTSPLILILLSAAAISLIIGYLPNQKPNLTDAVLILIIVFVSGISGFFQEYKAEKSIEALRKISTPSIQAIRGGQAVELPVTEITVGDIVLLEAGDIVPADGKILESFSLTVDESVLTGESDEKGKVVGDEVFMNTSVCVGSAKIKITKIGMQTRVGRIADKLQKIKEEKTLFEQEIAVFSRKISWLTGIVTAVIFIGNYFKHDLYLSMLTAVSLAVAAIPEGLPAVVVLSLALGAKTMYKNNVLIRKLDVVESIGAVDVICTDKTGTITKNEMTVAKLYFNNKIMNIGTVEIGSRDKKEVVPLLQCGVICNNTRTKGHPEGKRVYSGDQTEVALVKVGERFNLLREELDKKYARVNELAFSSERKMMSVVVQDKTAGNAKLLVYAKGAPEVILSKCDRIMIDGRVKKLSREERNILLNQNNDLAMDALRVLGFAYKETGDVKKDVEKNLIWIGLQAMADLPYPEIKQVLNDCRTAGIRVIMITGDNATTAGAVADSIGLASAAVLEGGELDKMNARKLEQKLDEGVNIFARTTPFHKLRILKILQKNNRVVMTGDGVNDSLALKQANVGVAMGLKGTAVAKEASDIILLNDNFSTIVKAVKEGRRIFNNIRKFINYLLVSNMAEVFVLFSSALFFTLKEPILLPVQILWVNLLTDGLPALALGADPARKDIMLDPPRPNGGPIIDKKLGWLIGAIGIKKTLILLATFLVILPLGEEVARTVLLTGFILYEFVRIASIRYREKLSWFSNPWLLIALTASVFLQVIIMYSPLGSFFHMVRLGLYEWSILGIGVAVGYILAIIITEIIVSHFAEKQKSISAVAR